MSHSYKKNPYFVQEKDNKRNYRRQVRHNSKASIRSGKPIKRPTMFWNFKKRWTLLEAIRDYEPSAEYPTLESWIKYWMRIAVRK